MKNGRLKILLLILIGVAILAFGVQLTNQSRSQQTTRVLSNQESSQSGNDSYSGSNGDVKKPKGAYNTDLLKESLGGK